MEESTQAAGALLDELVNQVITPGTRNANLNSTAKAFSKALRNAGFLTIHFRNPLIDEGRMTRLILGKLGRKLTIKNLRVILGNRSVSEVQANKFHDHLLDIYFGLIGRSDSFSDAALRTVARGEADRTFIFTFVSKIDGSHIMHEQTDVGLRIEVSRTLQYRLLGWDGENIQQAKVEDCKLLYPLYQVVWDNLAAPHSDDDLLRKCRETLAAECFFASREAFVSGEAAKLIRNTRDNPSTNQALLIFDELFARDTDGNRTTLGHDEKLARIEQVLAMIQAVAIYAPVSGDEFTLFAHKVKPGLPFASGLTVGGSVEQLGPLQGDSLALILQLERCCDLYGTREHGSNLIEWTTTEDVREEAKLKLEAEGLGYEVFDCLAYCADGLLGKKHEGEKLSFRIAVGTDEALRQCFTPLFGKSGLEENEIDRKFFRIEFPRGRVRTDPDWNRVRNELDRLVAVIQGNYSFVQDNSIYLCLAYSEGGLQMRYLAQLNSRVQHERGGALSQTVSRIEQVESLSKVIPQVILAFLDSDDSGYVAFGARIWGIGIKGKPNQWRVRKERWFAGNLALGSASNGPQRLLRLRRNGERFCDNLYQVIELIAEAPGKGATFVIGPWRRRDGLKNRSIKMTPAFEMVEGWLLNRIDKDILYQAAIQDGATIIATDEKRIYCRRQLSAVDDQGPFDPYKWRPNEESPLVKLWDDAGSEYKWPEWGKWFKWGTRHKSAAGLAYIGKGKYTVICVSSDGDVHLFDGRHVLELSKPIGEGNQ
jgi:hypothetical protein